MRTNKKIAVYTCITGNYDELNEIDAELLEKNVDYYCFTNNKEIVSKTWQIIYIEDFSLSNHMLNRKIKILGHKIINDYDILIYIDGNCTLKRKATELIKNECDLEKFPLYAFKHSARDCIYDEAEACIKFKKETKEKIDKILKFYKKNNFPKKYGLCEMGCFIKKPKDKEVIKLMNSWYEMLEKYSERDQLSFMWCVYQAKFPLGIIELSIYNNQYITFIQHKKKENINQYRLYFGNSNDFNIERLINGAYNEMKSNMYYIHKMKVPCDTNRIEYEPAYFSGIEFKNFDLKINGKKTDYEIIYYNYYNIENKNIFYNEFPVFVITGDFHKNDYLDMCIELIPLTKKELLTIMTNINNNLEVSKSEPENYQNKLEISKSELTNSKNKIDELEKTLENKQKEYEELKIEMDKTKHEKAQLEEKNNKIVNSKGWQLLEKIRKVRNIINHK